MEGRLKPKLKDWKQGVIVLCHQSPSCSIEIFEDQSYRGLKKWYEAMKNGGQRWTQLLI